MTRALALACAVQAFLRLILKDWPVFAFTFLLSLAMFVAIAAHAGDSVPGSLLWPPEREYAVSIPMGEMPTCQQLRDCCGIHRNCGGYATGPLRPAPVPLPATGLLLLLGMAGLWRMRQ